MRLVLALDQAEIVVNRLGEEQLRAENEGRPWSQLFDTALQLALSLAPNPSSDAQPKSAKLRIPVIVNSHSGRL